jgi:WD40 repeat protein
MQTLRVREGGSAEGHGGEVFSCVYSSDGVFVLSAGWDGCLRLWQSADAQPVACLQAGGKPLSVCAFSPEGTSWLSGSMEGVLSWWDALSHCLKQNFIAHIRPISALQFSPNGRYLATASWDRKLLLRRVGDEREGRAMHGHHDIVAGCRWTPDSQQLLSWSHDRTLRLWDAETACEVARFTGHADRITTACISRDGRWAVSGSRDGTIKLWDLGRRTESRSVQLKDEVRGCWCLPDSASVVTVGADGWIVSWSLPDFEVQAELDSAIRALCGDLSPNGDELVLGNENGHLHFVAIDGVTDAPIQVTATPVFEPKTGVITRFLGKHKINRAYRYRCPACGQTTETPHLSPEAIPCPSCRRLLRVSTEETRLPAQV